MLFRSLNDHLAGSVAALELLEYLEKTQTGKAMGRFVPELRADIAADRRELEALMARLHIAASPSRAAAARLAERMTEIKLRLDDRRAEPSACSKSWKACR